MRNSLFFTVFLAPIFFASCDFSMPNVNKKNITKKPNGSVIQTERVELQDKKGFKLVYFDINAQEINVFYDQAQRMIGERKDNNRWQFIDKNGDIVALALLEGFNIIRLYQTDKKLLYRVVIERDKIRVYEDEKDLSFKEVRQIEQNRCKVFEDNKEIGRTKLQDGMIDIDGTGIDLKFPAKKHSYAFGIYLINDVPKEIRYIIMSLLLEKNL